MPPDKPREKPHDKPQEKSPHKRHDHLQHDKELRHALNSPENAHKAVEIGKASLSRLVAGRVWRHRTPHGEEIKGSLTLDNSPVVVLHFSPEDGSILPKGLHGLSEANPDIVALVENRLAEIAQHLTVLEGVEFREPESCWAVPVACQGRIVGHIKVSSDGSRILPDRKTIDELKY